MADPAGKPLNELEAFAQDCEKSVEELRNILGHKRWQRLPTALTPAQKAKIKRELDATKSSDSSGKSKPRHSSGGVTRNSYATRVERGASTAQNTLTTFETRDDSDTAIKAQSKAKANEAHEQRMSHAKKLEPLGLPAWKEKEQDKIAEQNVATASPVRHDRHDLNQDRLDELIAVAHGAFPPRMELPVLICDVYEEGADIEAGEVGKIESYWKEKPKDAIVRWIHAPLGNGIVHSSIEDMFRHDQPPGRQFTNAGPPGFPFLDLDSVQFRSVEEVEHMRLVHDTLKSNEDLRTELNQTVIGKDQNETFKEDLDWRLQHLGKTLDYWETVISDVPLELTETFSSGGGEGPLRPPSLGTGPIDPSILAKKVKQFHGTHLTWAPFRTFHRADGTLLTMSAATGVDLLHRDFKDHIKQTLEARLKDPDASAVGALMAALQERGASEWYQHTVEYFLVYLVTEIGITPHNHFSGHSAASLLAALQSISRDLKIRRYDKWVPKESTKLVKEYIMFLDELRALSVVLKRRVSFFERLATDVMEHKRKDKKAGNERKTYKGDGKKPEQRVDWALRFNRSQKAAVDAVLEDTAQALAAFFQLGSIEQNDMAYTNDRRNKAILIFTTVTVIFLPLSFFSSYWGTNFADIRDTPRTEHYFWQVGGSLTAGIILLLCLIAFWSRVWSWLKAIASYRPPQRERVRPREKDVEALKANGEKFAMKRIESRYGGSGLQKSTVQSNGNAGQR